MGRARCATTTAAAGAGVRWWVGFADRGYRVLLAVILCYALAEMTLNVAMPVYFVDTLGLPGWVPGAVFVINTVMIGVGQGLVVRAMTGAVRRRVLHAAIVFSAVSFVLFYAAGALSVVAAAAARAGRGVRLHPGRDDGRPGGRRARRPRRRRPSSGAATWPSMQLAWSLSGAVAPLLYSALLHRGSLALWGGTLVLCVVWAVLVRGAGRPDAAGGPPGHQRRRAGHAGVRVTVDPVAETPTTP